MWSASRREGEFIWHQHADTDETFIVLDGQLRIDWRADGAERRLDLTPGALARTQRTPTPC